MAARLGNIGLRRNRRSRSRSTLWPPAFVVSVLLTLHVAASAPAAAPTTTVLQVTSRVPSQVPVDTRLTISGTVTTGGEYGRVVLLERATVLGYQPVRRTRSTPDGAWRLRVPTSWYHQARLRVRAPADLQHTAAVRGPYDLRVTPGYDPSGHAGSWNHLSGIRASWGPCDVITYRVNPGGRSGAVDVVRQALRRVHQASGLRFRFLGTTEAIPFNDVGRRARHGDERLTVSWAKPRQVHELREGVAGYGGFSYTGDDIVLGHVALDLTDKLPMRFGAGKTSGALVLHEVGHAMGLGHVQSESQRMHGAIGPDSVGRYGAGDLAGLRTKGFPPKHACTDQPTARQRAGKLRTVAAD